MKWDQPPAPGGAEPEHPAPTLTLAGGPTPTRPATSPDQLRRADRHGGAAGTAAPDAGRQHRADPRRSRPARRRPRCRCRAGRATDMSRRAHLVVAGSAAARPSRSRHLDRRRRQRPRRPGVGRPRRPCRRQHRSGPGQRDLQRGPADHVRGDDGCRSGRQPVVRRAAAGARHGRQRRRAAVGADRQLHGQLPGDVGRRACGLRVVVVSADDTGHRHTRPGRAVRRTPRPTMSRSGRSSSARWSLVAGAALWAARNRALDRQCGRPAEPTVAAALA